MKTSVKATLIAIAVAVVLLIAGIVFAISANAPPTPGRLPTANGCRPPAPTRTCSIRVGRMP